MFKTYPIENMKLDKINSPFGMRMHPVYKVKKLHEGIDYPAPTGTNVYAVADGVVSISKMQNDGGGYGNYIVINHGKFTTIYAHLSVRAVRSGQNVVAGQIIGKVGSTGASTGSHLHFGVCTNFSNKDWYDPLLYLKCIKEDDDEVIDKLKMIVNGKTIEVERIFKNDTNYIRLRDFEDKMGICKVEYDATKKMPIVTSK